MRDSTAHLAFDWRRLFGYAPQYARHSDEARFWIAIVGNAFVATIALCFAGGMLLMFIFGFAEMFVAK